MKRVLLLLGLLAAVCLPGLAATSDEDIAKYRADISEGRNLLRAGARDEQNRAIAKFKAALKVQPESAEAYYWLALAYSDQHNYLRAADNAREATTYDDRLAEAWLLWGQVLLYQREWNESLTKLETAARLAPEDPMVLFNLGRVHYHGFKNPDTALAKFRQAWQIGQAMRRNNPEMIAMSVRARLYMGCCEYDRGLRQDNIANFDNAINAFQDVIREQPNNYDAHFRLALALRKANRPVDSQRILIGLRNLFDEQKETTDRQKLAEINQQLAEINLQLADIYLKNPMDPNQSDRIQAILHLREFVRLTGEANHPAMEAVREFLSVYDEVDFGT